MFFYLNARIHKGVLTPGLGLTLPYVRSVAARGWQGSVPAVPLVVPVRA